MSWKSVHKDDNAFFLLDESDLWSNRLLTERMFVYLLFSLSENPKVSTISFATSHLVINCCQFPAMIICFLDIVDKMEVTSHWESVLSGKKEIQSDVWESNELQTWDSRQNSRYAEYGEVYEAFSRLVK